MKRPQLVNGGLWLAFLLALISSIKHLAWAFGTLEFPGWEWTGWISAVAVDAGLAALAYMIQQRRKAHRSALELWWGVLGFAGISALANFYHALSVESGGTAAIPALVSLDWLAISKAVALSATLPVMVVYLGKIVSGDDAAAALASERAAAREAHRAEREIQKSEEEQAQAVAQAAQTCPECGYVAKSQNALNGHMRAHRHAETEPLS